MCALKNLFGFREKKAAFPALVPVAPDKLSVEISLTNVATPSGQKPCWVYSTRGFQAMGQKEMVLVLTRDKDESPESYPQEPLNMFASFVPLISRGETYDVGDLPDFGGPGPFGRQLTFFPPLPVSGVNIPADTIIPFLIDHTEREMIHQYGLTRFIARLGKADGVYPCPVWSQRSRSFLTPGLDTDTVLDRVERVHFPRVVVYQEGDAIYLKSIPEMASSFRENMPALISVALLTGPDPEADAMLVWETGQEEHKANILPGANGDRMCGSFLIIVPEQPENRWEIYEDGFAWMVTRHAWEAARKVLMGGRSIKATMVGEQLNFTMI